MDETSYSFDFPPPPACCSRAKGGDGRPAWIRALHRSAMEWRGLLQTDLPLMDKACVCFQS
jgi:hypothetical protein